MAETPEAIVLAFFNAWGSNEETYAAHVRRWTPATVWENVGAPEIVGLEAALDFAKGFNAAFKIERSAVVMHAIAAAGNKVLTERSDIFYRADGSVVLDVRVMGIVEVEGDKIVAWRDYCDTKGLDAQLAPLVGA